MAPDENDKKDLDIEESAASSAPGDRPSEGLVADEPDEDVVDLGAGDGFTDAETVEYSAGGNAYGEDDFDQDLDIDITGDESIDFADEPDTEESGSNLKKMLAPALVLVIAAGVGGYIVMNPQILGRGNAVPEPEVAYMAPEPSTFSTVAPQPVADLSEGESSFAGLDDGGMGGDGLPQPTVNQNEIPRGPDAEVSRADFASVEEAPEPPVLEPVAEPEEDPFDLTEAQAPLEPVEAAPAAGMEKPPAINSPAISNDVVEMSDASASGSEESIMDDDSVAEGSREGALLPIADMVEDSEPASGGDNSFRMAQAEVKEVPAAVPPKAQLEKPAPRPAPQAAPAASPAVTAPTGNPSTTAAAGEGVRPASDTFYDGVIPTGPMADIGPRKVDPAIEPASQLVVVKKSHNAGDLEATLVAANRALQLQRYESSLELFNQLYERNPRDPRILMGRAVAQQNSGLVESAIRSYEELLAIDPKNADATLNMLGLLRTQYPSVALRRLMDLYQKNPDNAGIAAQIGVTQADLDNYDDALRYLGIAASLEPQNAQHFFNMGIIADRGGHTPEAIKYYEQALQLDAVYASGRSIPRESVYDRLSALRRR